MLRELSTKATQCRVVFYREVRVTEIKKKNRERRRRRREWSGE